MFSRTSDWTNVICPCSQPLSNCFSTKHKVILGRLYTCAGVNIKLFQFRWTAFLRELANIRTYRHFIRDDLTYLPIVLRTLIQHVHPHLVWSCYQRTIPSCSFPFSYARSIQPEPTKLPINSTWSFITIDITFTQYNKSLPIEKPFSFRIFIWHRSWWRTKLLIICKADWHQLAVRRSINKMND